MKIVLTLLSKAIEFRGFYEVVRKLENDPEKKNYRVLTRFDGIIIKHLPTGNEHYFVAF